VAGTFDWAAFERSLTDALVQAVRSTIAEYPDERLYAAALDHVYRETDGRITLPYLGMNSVEALASLPAEEQADLRWSAADWDHYSDRWLPEDLARGWEHALTAEACRGTTRQWVSTFRRYLAMLVRVCRRARTSLRTSGFTDRDFVVLLFDDEHYETLVKRILTRSEVSRHFPELDERAVELARVAALPEAERVAFYVSRLEAFSGPVDSEEAAPSPRRSPASVTPRPAHRDLTTDPWRASSSAGRRTSPRWLRSSSPGGCTAASRWTRSAKRRGG
jgi:hypothetical protein